ncbi:UPF0160 protein MYG1, mitochondrial [Cimex lectularius]|uniref:Uncharacterized protein n=1 Tax=Cimex lectularius TaxID=79782 RepID=A0A8I6SB45_CIMLE|nr:UPF0160 protein MYG1, mitochondrial [Cimex lectularius]
MYLLKHRSGFSFSKLFKRFLTSMKVLKTIGTHDGTFHCDEVLGCSMLKIVYPDAEIVRSRKDEVLNNCDIVIDVGGKFDPDRYLFDHHQKSFDHSMSTLLPGKKWTMKLSSAGLVYCHFGKDIIKVICKDMKENDLESVFDKVYEGFVQEVDAIDNGVPICDGKENYFISTNLSSRVSRFNRSWIVPESKFDETEAFYKAMDLVTGEFIDKVRRTVTEWLPAKTIVENALEKRHEIHPSGEIIELETFCPWKGHFFALEEQMHLEPSIKFVLFQEKTVWRVQAVSKNETSFELRTPLHEQWRGLRDEELSSTAGISGCIFVHSTGFIGGNQTREGALQMAAKSLKAN